jgi:hypothetical protein
LGNQERLLVGEGRAPDEEATIEAEGSRVAAGFYVVDLHLLKTSLDKEWLIGAVSVS